MPIAQFHLACTASDVSYRVAPCQHMIIICVRASSIPCCAGRTAMPPQRRTAVNRLAWVSARGGGPEVFERGVSWGTALRARVKQLFSASRAGEGQPGGRLQARQEHHLTNGGRQGAGRGGGGGRRSSGAPLPVSKRGTQKSVLALLELCPCHSHTERQAPVYNVCDENF